MGTAMAQIHKEARNADLLRYHVYRLRIGTLLLCVDNAVHHSDHCQGSGIKELSILGRRGTRIPFARTCFHPDNQGRKERSGFHRNRKTQLTTTPRVDYVNAFPLVFHICRIQQFLHIHPFSPIRPRDAFLCYTHPIPFHSQENENREEKMC